MTSISPRTAAAGAGRLGAIVIGARFSSYNAPMDLEVTGSGQIVRSFACVVVAVAFACFCGCERMVSQVTSVPASWAYVEDSWGGVALGKVSTSDSHIALVLTIGVHEIKSINSGICVREVAGKVRGSRLLVRFQRSLCGPDSITPYPAHKKTVDFTVRVAKPRPGTYTVNYDDEVARYPRLGEVRVE